MKRILIIGYGNPLRGDDGVGWRSAERLRSAIDDPNVEILALHQLAPELMESISHFDRVIFIDAADGDVPGEIREHTLVPTGARTAFTHHATPVALVAGAGALYGHAPEAFLVTVTGADFSLSEELSPIVAARVDEMVAIALRLMT